MKAAETIVSAELDNDDFRAQSEDGRERCDRVLGGCAAGALILHLVVVTACVELLLKIIGIRLPKLQAVAGGDAIAKADQDRTVGCERGDSHKKCQKRNDKSAANVHKDSVAKSRD